MLIEVSKKAKYGLNDFSTFGTNKKKHWTTWIMFKYVFVEICLNINTNRFQEHQWFELVL